MVTKKTDEVSEEADVFTTGEQFARDRAEGWFTFDKVGDKIGGFIRDMWEAPANGMYKAQRCFSIEKKDGSVWNVGLKRTNYSLTRTDALQIGDELGIIFEKEIAPKTKGFHPAKSLTFVNTKHGERILGQQAKDMKSPEPLDMEDDGKGNDIPFD